MNHQPIILFGAFDRHNFGDLLFPHVVSSLIPNRRIEFAGLAHRDLRAWGGHLVKPMTELASEAHLVHCGGELLTCTAYQAAVMLQQPEQAAAAIGNYDEDAAAAKRWAANTLGTESTMPYVQGQGIDGKVVFNAVGGVEWQMLAQDQRNEVLGVLKSADWITVRDQATQNHLKNEGVAAALCPDPAVMVAACFDGVIQAHRRQGAVQKMDRMFPQGYVACQFSAEFGDDATLDRMAQALTSVSAQTGLGVMLFRAGAAPWHDLQEPYGKLSSRMPAGTVCLFPSLHLWDLCALIAASRAFCGSSLHGRIVALAFGLPRLSLLSPQQGGRPSKVAAFIKTWEPAAHAWQAGVDEMENALLGALGHSREELLETAVRLAALYKESQQRWLARLD